MRTITEGVWAMAPIRLQAHMTHRKIRKTSWQPGMGHFPGTAVANLLSADTQEHPLRFCGDRKGIKKNKNKKQNISISQTSGIKFDL